MKLFIQIVTVLLIMPLAVSGFSSSTHATSKSSSLSRKEEEELQARTTKDVHAGNRIRQELFMSSRKNSEWGDQGPKFRICNHCPIPETSPSEDRRALLFSTLGALWAASAGPAAAIYGEDAKMSFPNPLDALNDRTTKECLVESLGNRECLVYVQDPENLLYKGADSKMLFQRIEKASQSLATIPALIESKKWSQVTGVLTGPMGTLVATMDQLIKLSSSTGGTNNKEDEARDLSKRVKADIIALNQFAQARRGKEALQAHEQATKNLISFLESL